MTNYLSPIPTLNNSLTSQSNLPSILRALAQSGSTASPANQLSQAQKQYQSDDSSNNQNGLLKQMFNNNTDPAQSGLNNANAMFGTYDPASAGLSNANDIFGTFGGLDAAGAADAGAGLGAADLGAAGGADLGLAALFA